MQPATIADSCKQEIMMVEIFSSTNRTADSYSVVMDSSKMEFYIVPLITITSSLISGGMHY